MVAGELKQVGTTAGMRASEALVMNSGRVTAHRIG
jgi:hypothetical protein